jgi:AcrR family transcriptional regulator
MSIPDETLSPAPASTRQPRADADSTELKERILAHATVLFAAQGYGGTSIRQVCEAAACTKPALYYYFHNKSALFLEILQTEADALSGIIEETVAAPGSLRERLVSGLHNYLIHHQQNPMTLALLLRADMQGEAGQPEFDFGAVKAEHRQMLTNILEDGIRSGEVRKDVPAVVAVRMLEGAIQHTCIESLCGDVAIEENFAEQLIDLFLRGVAT